MDAAYYRDLISDIYRRPWLILVDVLAAATGALAWFRDIGAPRPMIIAGSEGTGELPEPGSAEWILLGIRGDTVMGGVRAYADAVTNLAPEHVARVNAWDPRRRAGVLGGFLVSSATIADRPVYGGRPAHWEALENKITVGSIWEAAGVPTAPFEVVPATAEALRTAAARLDRGAGTVWVGDNKEGFHGGGEYLRWVCHDGAADEAAQFLAAHCDVARVMPFLDGIPCSIHGMVFDDTVICFRPVEMVTLRVPGSTKLRYAGVASFWNAPERDADQMRQSAIRVGDHLRDLVGFRGLFTMDGVMTADGFLPTELNPRPGAGIAVVVAGVGDLPMMGLNRTLIEREALDFRPEELEALILAGWDRKRGGGGHTLVDKVAEATHEVDVVFAGGRCRPADAGDTAQGTLSFGPGATGGFVRISLDPEHIAAGPPAAPKASQAFALADELWDTGIGPTEPAPELR